MTKPKKKTIKVKTSLHVSDIAYITLGELRDKVASWIGAFGQDAMFKADETYDGVDMSIEYGRQETDDEYDKRIAKNKKAEASRKVAAMKKKLNTEQGERTLYEQLKKKYG